jgi:hypothetical protein
VKTADAPHRVSVTHPLVHIVNPLAAWRGGHQTDYLSRFHTAKSGNHKKQKGSRSARTPPAGHHVLSVRQQAHALAGHLSVHEFVLSGKKNLESRSSQNGDARGRDSRYFSAFEGQLMKFRRATKTRRPRLNRRNGLALLYPGPREVDRFRRQHEEPQNPMCLKPSRRHAGHCKGFTRDSVLAKRARTVSHPRFIMRFVVCGSVMIVN